MGTKVGQTLSSVSPAVSAVFGSWTNSSFLLAFILYFILYFFNSMAPEASFDGSRYHLALAGRYLRDHGFHRITNNMYASLSQGVEMLYLWAFAFGQHSAAAMVHFAFLVALVWQMISGQSALPIRRTS